VIGISPSRVGRIWAKAGLKPHLVKRFKISNDPQFQQKVTDIVGLYLNPPERAVVLRVDEKSQIQALDRTQPGVPLKKGWASTMTHDYKRHGTTTLIAALDVKSGLVIGECLPRHRPREFLRFLHCIERAVLSHLGVHLICDNYSTDKTPEVKGGSRSTPASRCISRRPAPPGPTSSSGSSPRSQLSAFGEPLSRLSPSSNAPSTTISITIMPTPSHSRGPKAQR